MTQADLHSVLRPHRVAVLSTVTVDHLPQSALVGIAVTSALEIIFDTVTTARKYANLHRNPRCSLVIGWEGEQTIQYEGVATDITASGEFPPYFDRYLNIWPDADGRQHLKGLAYFVVRPLWIRYSDYDASPPSIEEFSF